MKSSMHTYVYRILVDVTRSRAVIQPNSGIL